MTGLYSASRPVTSDTPDVVSAAIREATTELHEILGSNGIEVSFEAIALLGHTESWDSDGQRWVHVTWRTGDV
ncbi:hypothetical protein [Arthrobacter sp. GMC3]|uniref:hypothetical protein n=1 Tax=Arthrobacter sp. GMC3 TaxID=2058894 RepID=UPI0011B06093|nr:hypothetical protein [Arthrobacter sp. GMC3]